MAIYDKNGNVLNTAYAIDGSEIEAAYDIDGIAIYENYDLSVMSFNVQWFLNINSDLYNIVKNAIQTYNPDLIGFQEWEDRYGIGTINGLAPDIYLEGIGYDVVVGSGNPITNKNALASKYQLSNASETGFTNTSSYGYDKAYFTHNGKTIAFYSTHLYYPEASTSERIAECVQILADAENEDYVIITGDFNTLASSVTDTEYADAIGLFDAAGYNVANGSIIELTDTWYDGTTVEASTKYYPCDNIITSGNIDITNVIIDTAKLTAGINKAIDHLPIIAYLTVN